MLWVDVPAGDPDADAVLGEVFGFHPKAVQDCVQREPVPKVHVYADHVFVVLHAPEQGCGGHIHYVESTSSSAPLPRHGARSGQPAVIPRRMQVETDAVGARVDGGRYIPATGYELSTADRLGADRADA